MYNGTLGWIQLGLQYARLFCSPAIDPMCLGRDL